jgi:hypothetical protein
MQEFNVRNIVHRRGASHGNADGLSFLSGRTFIHGVDEDFGIPPPNPIFSTFMPARVNMVLGDI